MNFAKGSLGWIEVVCGPMFSGKSEELIRRLRRAEIARQRVQIFKPMIDQRYSDDHIVSHSALKIRSTCVKTAAEMQAALDLRTEVIGIDEGQFLGTELVDIVVRLADMPPQPPETRVRIAVGRIDLLALTLECRFAGTVRDDGAPLSAG